jgi:hypothetical protein
MDRNGHRMAVPRAKGDIERRPLLDFSSGYIARARDSMPVQGTEKPWRVPQNYFRDVATLGFGRVTDDAIEFR